MACAEIEHRVGRSRIKQLHRGLIVPRGLSLHDPRHDPADQAMGMAALSGDEEKALLWVTSFTMVLLSMKRADYTLKDGQGIVRPVCFAFLEIISSLSH